MDGGIKSELRGARRPQPSRKNFTRLGNLRSVTFPRTLPVHLGLCVILNLDVLNTTRNSTLTKQGFSTITFRTLLSGFGRILPVTCSCESLASGFLTASVYS